MKRIIILIVIIALVGIFYPKNYTNGRTYVTQENGSLGHGNPGQCLGFSVNKGVMDAAGNARCFGLIVK